MFVVSSVVCVGGIYLTLSAERINFLIRNGIKAVRGFQIGSGILSVGMGISAVFRPFLNYKNLKKESSQEIQTDSEKQKRKKD